MPVSLFWRRAIAFRVENAVAAGRREDTVFFFFRCLCGRRQDKRTHSPLLSLYLHPVVCGVTDCGNHSPPECWDTVRARSRDSASNCSSHRSLLFFFFF